MRKKYKTLAALVIFMLIGGTSQANINDIKASEAHIYSNHAIFKIPLKNPDTVELYLPSTIDENSIRIVATKDREINNYSITTIPMSRWTPPALSDLASQIEKDKEALKLIEININSLEMAIAQLGSIKPEIVPDEVPEYINTVQISRKSLNSQLLKEQEKADILQENITDSEALLKLQSAGKPGKVIKLSINSQGMGDLYLICRTQHAGWSNSYRLNLDPSGKTLIATLEGKVFQKSGINIDGDIILHQGNPGSRLYTPDIRALTVGTLKPVVRSSSYKMETTMIREMAEPLMIQEDQVKENLIDRTTLFRGIINGNGVKNNIRLERWKDTVEISLLALPYKSTKAWLMARIDKMDTPTVKAPAEIYVEGNYSGKSSMKKIVRGQELYMAFGLVPEIGIEREKIIPKDKSSWIGKGTLKEGYTVTLINGLNKKIDLTVKDRIPISVEGSISVKNLEIYPSVTKLNDKKGILTWDLSLKPGEQREIKVIYEIKYPSDKELSFSDR